MNKRDCQHGRWTKKLKTRVRPFFNTVARFYMRYVPVSFGKRFLWERLRWVKKTYKVKTKSGFRVLGSTMSGHGILQYTLYYFGVWEPHLTAFITRRLRGVSGRVFIDVGANVGYYSLLATKIMEGGHTVAVEPFPSTCVKLEQNIQLNGVQDRIRVVPYAASDADGISKLYLDKGHSEGHATILQGRFSASPVQIETKPLAEILTGDEIRTARFLKMDVEGAEWQALSGLKDVWDEFPVDMEFAIEIAADGNDQPGNATRIFSLFESKGYHPYVLRNTYDINEYIHFTAAEPPRRIREMPTMQADVVFSKIDADYL